MDLEFYVRVRTCEKRVTGKQPLATKQAFKLSLKYFKKIIKQLLNSVLAGYDELLRPRFVLSASASADNTNLCLNNSSYPAQPRSIIVYCQTSWNLYYSPKHVLVRTAACIVLVNSRSGAPKREIFP